MDTLQIAITQLGIQEQPRGSNWGSDVKKYLLSVGIDFPASWCMAFVYWCVNQAATFKTINNPLVKTGGVLKQWDDIDPKLKVIQGTGHGEQMVSLSNHEPQPGDIFIMDFGHGLGHCGIVESVTDSVVHTIEGNTNDTGSREGYEVCRRVRPLGGFKGFIRPGI